MRCTGLALMMAVVAAGCNGDPVTAGRRVLDSDPAKAAALFREAGTKKSPCFDCDAWLGMALERTKDTKGAMEAYERALALPESRSRPEPIAARLLNLYEASFRDSPDVAERTALARKAAPLEASLSIAKPWANPFLLELARKEITSLAEAGKSRETAAAIEVAMGLYLPADQKKQFATEATEALRTAFVARMKATFEKELAAALDRDGLYDAKTAEVILDNRFTIPAKKADPRFDPASDDFATNLRKEACLPLRKSLEDLVARAAPVLGLRKATPADLDWMFATAFKDARTGYATYGSTDRAPAGETWLCVIRLPLSKFLGELYRFAE